jgi:hypothetical protein
VHHNHCACQALYMANRAARHGTGMDTTKHDTMRHVPCLTVPPCKSCSPGMPYGGLVMPCCVDGHDGLRRQCRPSRPRRWRWSGWGRRGCVVTAAGHVLLRRCYRRPHADAPAAATYAPARCRPEALTACPRDCVASPLWSPRRCVVLRK